MKGIYTSKNARACNTFSATLNIPQTFNYTGTKVFPSLRSIGKRAVERNNSKNNLVILRTKNAQEDSDKDIQGLITSSENSETLHVPTNFREDDNMPLGQSIKSEHSEETDQMNDEQEPDVTEN